MPETVFIARNAGNALGAKNLKNVNIGVEDIAGLVAFAQEKKSN
ncbi:hypothetical protein OH492_02205 [Vibrio chagasii]|nr:hypothetical protein [Vibrio chagasii]